MSAIIYAVMEIPTVMVATEVAEANISLAQLGTLFGVFATMIAVIGGVVSLRKNGQQRIAYETRNIVAVESLQKEVAELKKTLVEINNTHVEFHMLKVKVESKIDEMERRLKEVERLSHRPDH